MLWKRAISASLSIMLLAIPLAGCSTGQDNGTTLSYKETKSMMMDILQTEEGKKLIREISLSSDDDESTNTMMVQMLNSNEGRQIQLAVKDVLTDPGYTKVLEKMMVNPKFAAEFAKVVQTENKQIHKDLMKDPEYQTMMIETMKNEEFRTLVFEVLKGTDYRKQVMMIMQESLESPAFKLKVMELLEQILVSETMPEASMPSGKEDAKEEGDKSKKKEEEDKKKEEKESSEVKEEES